MLPLPRAAVVFLLLIIIASPSMEGASPTVNAQRDGTNVVIHFSGRLQRSSQASGPYTNVAGARSPHVTPLSVEPHQFWRSVLSDVRAITTGDGQILTDQPDQSGAPILGENAVQVLLILIAFGVFILILLMAVGRSSGHTHS